MDMVLRLVDLSKFEALPSIAGTFALDHIGTPIEWELNSTRAR